jgi:hypothetical protein
VGERISPWARGLAGAYGVARGTDWRDATFGYLRSGMADGAFNLTHPNGTPKAAKTLDPTEIAARDFVYGLLDAAPGHPMRWGTLKRMYESRPAIARAVERGWVILWGTSGEPLELKASLTDEGRRLARRGKSLR